MNLSTSLRRCSQHLLYPSFLFMACGMDATWRLVPMLSFPPLIFPVRCPPRISSRKSETCTSLGRSRYSGSVFPAPTFYRWSPSVVNCKNALSYNSVHQLNCWTLRQLPLFATTIQNGTGRSWGWEEGNHHLRTVPPTEVVPQDPAAVGARAGEEV